MGYSNRREVLRAFAVGVCSLSFLKGTFASSDEATTQRYYDDAITMLKNGHWYERCIGKLSYCVTASPNESKYHLALGCAYASRLASYCVAFQKREREPISTAELLTLFEDYRKKNPIDPKVSTKEDADAFLATLPQESAPTVTLLKTLDDNRPFAYDNNVLVKKLHELAGRAKDCWETALVTCKTQEEKKSTLTTQLWGMKLLLLCHLYLTGDELASTFTPKQTQSWHDAMLGAGKELLSLFPDEASSWALMGEALSKPNETIWSVSSKEIKEVYKNALSHTPDNPALLFRLFQIVHSAKDSEPEAELYLRRYVNTQKGNAYAYFCLAGYLSGNLSTEIAKKPLDKKVKKRKVDAIIQTVNDGVVCSSYRIAPKFVELVETLRPAYSYLDAASDPSTIVRLDFHVTQRLLLTTAKKLVEEDTDYAKKCCYIALAMSKRILTAIVGNDQVIPASNPNEHLLELITEGDVISAYKTLLVILEKGEDATELSKIEQEQKSFLVVYKERRQNHD